MDEWWFRHSRTKTSSAQWLCNTLEQSSLDGSGEHDIRKCVATLHFLHGFLLDLVGVAEYQNCILLIDTSEDIFVVEVCLDRLVVTNDKYKKKRSFHVELLVR